MAEVSTVQQLPAPFIEAAGKTYLADLQKAVGGLRGLDVSKLYPGLEKTSQKLIL